MLTLLLFHIVTTAACLLAGFLFYTYIIGDNTGKTNNTYRPLINYLVTGLIILTFFTQLFILFLPATLFFRLGLLTLIATCTWLARKSVCAFIASLASGFRNTSILTRSAFAATWCMILLLNAGPTMMDDTDSYHIQAVKWIQEYGSVPGLANLHRRFGFNSSWFSSIALFSFEWKGYNFFTGLNGLLSVWFGGYLLMIAGSGTKRDSSQRLSPYPLAYFLVFLLAVLAWPVIRGNAGSANYDFITLLVLFVLFTQLLPSSSSHNNLNFTCEWIIWPVFLFTVRIINFPFLLLSLFAILVLWKTKNWRTIVLYSSLSLFAVIPFLTRNVIVSGYPFYPALYFDWFNVDWKAGKEQTVLLLNYIRYYNRVSTGIMDLDQTAALGFPEWIGVWFRHMLTYNKIILLPGLLGISLSPFIKRTVLHSPAQKIFFAALLVQLLTWFFSAPDPRFIYGCLFAGILLAAIMLTAFVKKGGSRSYSALLFITTVAIVTFTINKAIRQPSYRNAIWPAVLPAPPVRALLIDNIEMHIPDPVLGNWNPRCYATELPCLYEPDPLLQARGKTVADGFKLKK